MSLLRLILILFFISCSHSKLNKNKLIGPNKCWSIPFNESFSLIPAHCLPDDEANAIIPTEYLKSRQELKELNCHATNNWNSDCHYFNHQKMYFDFALIKDGLHGHYLSKPMPQFVDFQDKLHLHNGQIVSVERSNRYIVNVVTAQNQQLCLGQSGHLIFYNDKPFGMFVALNKNQKCSERGIILRLDWLVPKAQELLNEQQ